jgi:hypothetical protein
MVLGLFNDIQERRQPRNKKAAHLLLFALWLVGLNVMNLFAGDMANRHRTGKGLYFCLNFLNFVGFDGASSRPSFLQRRRNDDCSSAVLPIWVSKKVLANDIASPIVGGTLLKRSIIFNCIIAPLFLSGLFEMGADVNLDSKNQTVFAMSLIALPSCSRTAFRNRSQMRFSENAKHWSNTSSGTISFSDVLYFSFFTRWNV